MAKQTRVHYEVRETEDEICCLTLMQLFLNKAVLLCLTKINNKKGFSLLK